MKKILQCIIVSIMAMLIVYCILVCLHDPYDNNQIDVLPVVSDDQLAIINYQQEFPAEHISDNVVIQMRSVYHEAAEDNAKIAVVSAPDHVTQNNKVSFVDRIFTADVRLEGDLQKIFVMLLEHNKNQLLDAFAQSNNEVDGSSECQLCAIDIILKKIVKHRILSPTEIKILQRALINLYNFIETMKGFGVYDVLTEQQYYALQKLNKLSDTHENLDAQVKYASQLAALHALQKINTVDRQG